MLMWLQREVLSNLNVVTREVVPNLNVVTKEEVPIVNPRNDGETKPLHVMK